MNENDIPQYCQDWIKSKKLVEIEMYGKSSTYDTNISGRFECSMISHFINYWMMYLAIHEDIALLYCDKEYYDELRSTFNSTVGVYNPEKFTK